MDLVSFKKGLKSTLKSEDTEGFFEIYVTRSSGYLWALFFKKLGVHPNVVTIISIILGMLAGYMFYFDDLRHALLGIFLLIWANWYDCADGQLARMTGKKSLLGRVLDGFAGDLWFFSIYFFICLRLTDTWGIYIWLLAAFSGFICHSKQCALADYYRNIHMFFQKGNINSEFGKSSVQVKKMKSLSWKSDWFEKLYLFFYIKYTKSQESLSPSLQKLLRGVERKWLEKGEDIPSDFRDEYRRNSKPLMKYTNILTFDTRAFVLFISVLVKEPWFFFVFEVTVLNILFFYMRYRHESFCKKMYKDYHLDVNI